MSVSNTKISVVVPFLNEADYIERCIESLLAQDMDSTIVELIFVDNNSTDSSVSIVSKYKQIRLLHEKKNHVYAARNTAINRANGEILAFTDADCIVSKNWVASILNEFKFNNVDILLGKRHFAEKTSYMARFMEDYENLKIEFILSEKDYKKCFGYTNNMAIRKSVYDRMGGNPPDREYLFIYRGRNKSSCIVFVLENATILQPNRLCFFLQQFVQMSHMWFRISCSEAENW